MVPTSESCRSCVSCSRPLTFGWPLTTWSVRRLASGTSRSMLSKGSRVMIMQRLSVWCRCSSTREVRGARAAMSSKGAFRRRSLGPTSAWNLPMCICRHQGQAESEQGARPPGT